MLKRFILTILCTAVFLTIAAPVYGQTDFVEFPLNDLTKWQLTNRQAQVMEYKGKTALNLKGAPGAGYALLKDVEFVNGIIDLDIAAIPKFTGILFRAEENGNYESIYFRPQNSKHKDPVKRKYVVQYHSPPQFSWSDLRKNFPGKYESAADLTLEEWFHVRVVVIGRRAKVFINNSKTPCLEVNDLKKSSAKGAVGVWCGNGSPGTFANFRVKKLAGNAGPRKERKVVEVKPGILKSYAGKYQLNPKFTVAITCEGKRLFTQATGQPRFEIFPTSESEFFLKVVDATIKFHKDKAGKVTGMTVFQNGRETKVQKVE